MVKPYLEGEENIGMDVQVGPDGEIECNAVDCAKKDPESVVVASVEPDDVKKSEGCCKEFYVDAKDVEKYASLTEKSMLEALNDVIAANESYGMTAANTVVVMSKGTEGYTRNLEKHGAACVRYVTEADDEIGMDVQVGPNKDSIRVVEDPQEANPVDAVKRNYDTVVVAKDGDDFFVDVEDVQKCADVRCESVVKTLNGIIAANESSGIEASKLTVIISENCRDDTYDALCEAGVNTKAENKHIMTKVASSLARFISEKSGRSLKATPGWNNINKEFKGNIGKNIKIGFSSKWGVPLVVFVSVLGGVIADIVAAKRAYEVLSQHKDEIVDYLNKDLGSMIKIVKVVSISSEGIILETDRK